MTTATRCAAVAAAVLLLAAPLAFAQDAPAACSEEDGPVVCTQCRRGADSNDIHGLPRRNAGFTAVSANWGAYTASWEIIGETCLSDDESVECDTTGAITQSGGAPPDDFGSYIESIGLYVGFGIFMAVLTGFSFICCCCGRCCCRCKGCLCNRGSGCCGGRYPTERGGCCGCLGFREKDGKLAYSPVEVWGTRIYMWTYCFCVVLFMSMGQFRGNEGVTTAMKAWAESPQGVVELVDGAVEPIGNFVTNIASDSVVLMLEGLNETITGAIDFDNLITQVDCVIERVEGLPNVDVFLAFVDSIVDTFDTIRGAADNINDAIDDLIDQQDLIRVAAEGLTYTVGNVSVNINAVSPSLNATGQAVLEVDAFVGVLMNDDDGIPRVLRQLAALNSTSLPADADIDDATTGGDKSLTTIVANPIEEGLTLQGKLVGLADTYAALPNYTHTSYKMQLYNDRIDQSFRDNVIGNLQTSINNTVNTLNGLKGTAAALNVSINLLIDTVLNLELSGVTDSMLTIETAILGVDFGPVFAEVDKVFEIPGVLPCMRDMALELFGLNDTVVELPSSLNMVTEMVDTLNETLTPALEQVNQMYEHEDTYNQQVATLNLTEMVNDVTGMKDDVDEQLGNLDVAGMLGDLEEMENQLDLDTGVVDDIGTLNSTMAQSKMSQDTMDVLVIFQQNIDLLISLVNGVADDLLIYEDGACVGGVDADDRCSVGGDCASGTCSGHRTRRCVGALGTACTDDGDCTGLGDERCVVDSTRFGALSIVLQALKDSPNVGDEIAALGDVQGDSAIDTATFTDSMQEAQDAMDDVDTSTFQGQIGDVTSGLDSFDIADTRQQLNDTIKSLDDIDITAVNGPLLELNDTMATVDDQLTLVNDARALIVALRDLFLVEMPGYVSRLDRQRLLAIKEEHGLGQILLEVTSVIDDMTLFLEDATDLFGELATNFTADFQDQIDSLEVITDPSFRDNGPLYFFGAAMDKDNMVTPDEAGEDGRVYVDENGEEWSGGRVCYVRDCVHNEIDFLNSEPFDVVIEDQTGSPSPIPNPLGMSRADLMGIPYVVPFLIMLLGFTASVCFCSGKCGKCCSCCSCCWIGCQMPFLFGFVGTYWIFIMIFGDFCYGFENAGFRVLEAGGPAACGFMNGGEGTFEECSMLLPDPINTTVTVDVGAMYKGIMGGQCAPVDPMGPFWDSLSDNIVSLPVSMIDDMMNNTDGGGIPIRPKLKGILRGVGFSVGKHLGTFISELGDGIGCNGIHGAYMGFKEALCCETLDAAYWGLSSWYLIAFSYLFCGCGASVMGIKRFRNKLWGRAYDDAMERLKMSNAGKGSIEMTAYPEGGDPYGGTGMEGSGAPMAEGYDVPYADPTAYDDGGYDPAKGGYDQGGDGGQNEQGY